MSRKWNQALGCLAGRLACAISMAFAPAVPAAQLLAKVTNGGQPLPDAVVYATPVTGPMPSRARKEITIEQINKTFVPLISVAQTGTMVSLPNRDPIRHHVYSFSPAKTFEIKLYSGVPAKPVLFDKAGEVVLGCNIHDTMVAYVLVVETPYFAKADKLGQAVIDNLPGGEYDVQGWYPGSTANATKQRLKIGAGDNSTINLALPVRNLAGARPEPGK